MRDVSAIAAAAATATGQRLPTGAVRLAVREIGRAHLLAAPVELRALSRRELVRRLGATAAVVLPVVTTVVAPTVSEAQSVECADVTGACFNDAHCCGPECTRGGGCVCVNPDGAGFVCILPS